MKCRASSTAAAAVAGCRTYYSAAAQATAANSVIGARGRCWWWYWMDYGGVGIQNAPDILQCACARVCNPRGPCQSSRTLSASATDGRAVRNALPIVGVERICVYMNNNNNKKNIHPI